MSKLVFFYGTMNSGKSLKLIQDEYGFRVAEKKTLVLKPSMDSRDKDFVKTRIGDLKIKAKVIKDEVDILTIFQKEKPNIIFVDESQFLTPKQVFVLKKITSTGVMVYAYGLKVDFKTNLFEGSKRLLELADKNIEISSLCKCGKKATLNARIIDGKIVRDGKQIVCGAEDLYESKCFECYYKIS